MTRRPESVWKEIWRRWKEPPLWSYFSGLVYFILNQEIAPFDGMRCLEEGSGSGKTSFELALRGARPILLDVSREAIKLSKRIFLKKDADFVVGSIMALPFKDSSMDLVWNAGVLEHFKFKEQQLAISEAIRTLKCRRKLVVIVPNKDASFYNLFRSLSTKIGTWLFGYEEPLSRRDFDKFSHKPSHTRSCGLLWQFTFAKYLPLFSTVVDPAFQLAKRIFPFFEKLDKNYPGYFLAAIFMR